MFNVPRRMPLLKTLFAGCALVTSLLVSIPSLALIPAMLPDKSQVPAGEPLAIDGEWMISTLNKRIRIEGRRAYALDTWLHALVLRVQPNMVVMRNIEPLADGTYTGDDLPLLGKVTLLPLANGEIEATVATGLGPVKYNLIPLNRGSIAPAPVDEVPELGVPVEEAPIDEAPVDDPVEQPPYDDVAVIEELVVDLPVEDVPIQAPPGGLPPPVRPGPPPGWIPQELPKFTTAESFTGCQPDEKGNPQTVGDSPRDRLEARVDRVTQRQFAGFTLDEATSQFDSSLGECWMRLDGVWQENRNIVLDRSKDQPAIWGTDSPELIGLANGNYTDLAHLYIGSVGRDEKEIWVSEGLSPKGFVRFVSTDKLSLEETLSADGPVKVYVARGPSYLGARLELDLTASGRPRFRLGRTTYLRPSLALSETAMQEQTALNDAFLLQANLENLSASRRGYDVVKQDPFFLLENDKLEVFANFDPRRYYIAEQKTIPVGFKFQQDGTQGMLYNRSMSTSAKEYQNSVSVSLGATVEGKADPTGFAAKGSVSVDASVSWMEQMEESKTVAQALGYSRAKKYALIVDHPFVSLSNDFLDAVGDARKYGRYDHIIEMFGTHYPYAVTYGAAAKITHSTSEESFKKLTEWNVGVEGEMVAGMMGAGSSMRRGIRAGNTSGSSGTLGSEEATFVAVGGNGSWNENGYSLGPTPYPILLDLRPLHELLNQMNFPDQPEIHTVVRAGLKREIERYLARHKDTVSDRSLLPKLEPKKIETWHLYVRNTYCTGKKAGPVHSTMGDLELEAYMGSRGKGYRTTAPKSLTARCKKKRENTTYKYGRVSPGLIEITGTREQIRQYSLELRMKWRYKPSPTKKWRNHKKTFKTLSALKSGLAVGKSRDHTWKVGAKGLPDFVLKVRAKRIR